MTALEVKYEIAGQLARIADALEAANGGAFKCPICDGPVSQEGDVHVRCVSLS